MQLSGRNSSLLVDNNEQFPTQQSMVQEIDPNKFQEVSQIAHEQFTSLPRHISEVDDEDCYSDDDEDDSDMHMDGTFSFPDDNKANMAQTMKVTVLESELPAGLQFSDQLNTEKNQVVKAVTDQRKNESKTNNQILFEASDIKIGELKTTNEEEDQCEAIELISDNTSKEEVLK